MSWENYIDDELKSKYEIHDYKHAAAILCHEFPDEFKSITDALRSFTLYIDDITKDGGNESPIPKQFSSLLRPQNWIESKFTAELLIDGTRKTVETHKVDYLKGRVAFDLEWNSKDQTFDRDLFAFKTFFDYDKISLGILVTRSQDLNKLFDDLGNYIDKNGNHKTYKSKYGASTTHMGKLLPRLTGGRHGGCPILVFGMKRSLLSDSDKLKLGY